MLATFKLISSYFFKGFAGPFFMFIFPLLLILIVGESYVMTQYTSAEAFETALASGNQPSIDSASAFSTAAPTFESVGNDFRALTGGIIASSAVTISFLQLPGSVVEFKNSVLLKRIGATRLKIWQFFLVMIGFYGLLTLLNVLYIMLISGLLFATRMSKLDDAWSYVLPFQDNWGEVIGYLLLFYSVMVMFGLAIGSSVKKLTTSQIISTFLFFPTSFLIGGFVPPNLINASEVLSALRYVFPHTQPVVGFTNYWSNAMVVNSPIDSNEFIEFLGTSIGLGFGLLGIFTFITFKKFKWNN